MLQRHSERFYIFRTCGLYGIRGSSTKGYTFIDRILTQASEGRPLRIVDDVTCSPSYTLDVATAICAIVSRKQYGTYHVTNSGACTWFEFAREILSQAGLTTDLTPTTADAFPSLARRPAYSALANERFHDLGPTQPRSRGKKPSAPIFWSARKRWKFEVTRRLSPESPLFVVMLGAISALAPLGIDMSLPALPQIGRTLPGASSLVLQSTLGIFILVVRARPARPRPVVGSRRAAGRC